MVSGMKIDVAELAGVIVEGALFGIFLVLDIASIYILVGRKRYARLNVPMTLAAIVMMGLAVAQFVIDSVNIFMGFISLESLDRNTRLMFFSDLTQPIFAAKHAIYFTMLFVGDMIVIYRCYVVWNSSIKMVIVPILCSLGSAACAYQTIWAVRHPPAFPSLTFSQVEHNMGFAVFALSFAANVIATGLLAYKTWKADRGLRGTMSTISLQVSRHPITRIILESGAINTAYLLIYTVILKSGSNGIQVIACIVTPLVGIIFTTVIIRATITFQKHTVTSSSQNFTLRTEGAIELVQKRSEHSYNEESI